MTCGHLNIQTVAKATRLSKWAGGPITGYTVDFKVACADCGVNFKFLGSKIGLHPREPRLSADLLELRASIAPVKRSEH